MSAALTYFGVESLAEERVRRAHAAHHEAVQALRRVALELLELGHPEQHEAYLHDALHLSQRASRHLQQLRKAGNDNG